MHHTYVCVMEECVAGYLSVYCFLSKVRKVLVLSESPIDSCVCVGALSNELCGPCLYALLLQP